MHARARTCTFGPALHPSCAAAHALGVASEGAWARPLCFIISPQHTAPRARIPPAPQAPKQSTSLDGTTSRPSRALFAQSSSSQRQQLRAQLAQHLQEQQQLEHLQQMVKQREPGARVVGGRLSLSGLAAGAGGPGGGRNSDRGGSRSGPGPLAEAVEEGDGTVDPAAVGAGGGPGAQPHNAQPQHALYDPAVEDEWLADEQVGAAVFRALIV